MTRTNTAIFTFLITVSTSTGIAQSVDPIVELKACARMTDRDARFACLDNLGERVLQEESANKKPTPEEVAQPEALTTATATNVQPLPDDLGVSTFGDDQESKSIKYSGKIRSCKKGQYGDWYFFLENGQIWKEVNKRNRRFKECDFNVTIAKDVFGYKMRIDALEMSVRVRRHK